jgi:hypothetical protein
MYDSKITLDLRQIKREWQMDATAYEGVQWIHLCIMCWNVVFFSITTKCLSDLRTESVCALPKSMWVSGGRAPSVPNSALDSGEWSSLRLGPITSGERAPPRVHSHSHWRAVQPVCMRRSGGKFIDPARDRTTIPRLSSLLPGQYSVSLSGTAVLICKLNLK